MNRRQFLAGLLTLPVLRLLKPAAPPAPAVEPVVDELSFAAPGRIRWFSGRDISEIINETVRERSARIADNVHHNNALLEYLCESATLSPEERALKRRARKLERARERLAWTRRMDTRYARWATVTLGAA